MGVWLGLPGALCMVMLNPTMTESHPIVRYTVEYRTSRNGWVVESYCMTEASAKACATDLPYKYTRTRTLQLTRMLAYQMGVL